MGKGKICLEGTGNLRGTGLLTKTGARGVGESWFISLAHACTVQVPLGFDHKLVWTSQAELLIYGKRDKQSSLPSQPLARTELPTEPRTFLASGQGQELKCLTFGVLILKLPDSFLITERLLEACRPPDHISAWSMLVSDSFSQLPHASDT